MTSPTVTVGGVAAEVVSTVLTTDSAGLYQVTIRIPDAAPCRGDRTAGVGRRSASGRRDDFCGAVSADKAGRIFILL